MSSASNITISLQSTASSKGINDKKSEKIWDQTMI